MMDAMMYEDEQSEGESSVYEKDLVEGVSTIAEEDARERYDSATAELEFAEDELEEARVEFAAAKERMEKAQTLVEEANQVMEVIAEETAELLVADNPTNCWNIMYLKLVEYKKMHGHCEVERLEYKGNTGVSQDAIKLGVFESKNRTAIMG
jgi:exonuclease VII small subunit